MLQVADNLPLYGVCCYMDEVLHRPPSVLKGKYPECNQPLSKYTVSAPRCYCFLTHYPFFVLHMKVGQPSCWHCLSFCRKVRLWHSVWPFIVPHVRLGHPADYLSFFGVAHGKSNLNVALLSAISAGFYWPSH